MARDPTHTMSVKALGLTGVAITASPANVEHIVKTNFANYPKGELAVSRLEDFLGHGIFNSDGDQWLRQRRAASYEFGKRSFRSLVVDAARFEVTERLLPLLDRAWRDGRTLDLQDVLERFAFDSICRVAFGDDPACLAAQDSMAAPQSTEFMRAFNDAQNAVMARFMSPVNWLWRLKRLLNMEPERRMRSALGTIHGYAGRIVRERRERRSEVVLACRDDFLSRFAAAGEHSDESLRDVVTNFLLAGLDTTSSALSWFFWLVSTRPDVEDRIVREVRAVRASSHQGSITGAATFGVDELRDMHYLHAAITESMRLYPPVTMDTHGCREDEHLHRERVADKLFSVRHGADGGHMGQGLRAVQAGAVARRGRRVPAGEPVQVPGLPRRAKNVPRQGDGVHPDEIHCGVRAGEVQLPVCRRRGAAGARALAHAADGRRFANESDQEDELGSRLDFPLRTCLSTSMHLCTCVGWLG